MPACLLPACCHTAGQAGAAPCPCLPAWICSRGKIGLVFHCGVCVGESRRNGEEDVEEGPRRVARSVKGARDGRATSGSSPARAPLAALPRLLVLGELSEMKYGASPSPIRAGASLRLHPCPGPTEKRVHALGACMCVVCVCDLVSSSAACEEGASEDATLGTPN